jgi:hypothetical protein
VVAPPVRQDEAMNNLGSSLHLVASSLVRVIIYLRVRMLPSAIAKSHGALVARAVALSRYWIIVSVGEAKGQAGSAAAPRRRPRKAQLLCSRTLAS